MDRPRPTRLLAHDPAQGRPAWAAAPFRALAFRVGDRHFAVPLLGLAMDSDSGAFLLVLGDGRVALRCDVLGDAVDVDLNAVRWRRSAAQAAWLAGGALRDPVHPAGPGGPRAENSARLMQIQFQTSPATGI